MVAAKLVYNTNNFTQIGGEAQAQAGLPVPAPLGRNRYNIGFEEWLNNGFLREHKLGYLDCYRDTRFPANDVQNVGLFMFSPNDRKVYSVGKLTKVRQLRDDEIQGCRYMIEHGGFINSVQQHFRAIGDHRPIENNPQHEYWRCFKSNKIDEEAGKNFILNITYDSIELFHNRRDLTALIGKPINSKWNRLSKRYHTVPDGWEQFGLVQFFTPA